MNKLKNSHSWTIALSKLLPQKMYFQSCCLGKDICDNCSLNNTSRQLLFIYSSLESLEKTFMSSVVSLIPSFSMYLHSFKNACG